MLERRAVPARAVLLGMVAVGLAVFVALWALVAVRWAPLLSLDARGVAGAHGLAVHDSGLDAASMVVTDLGAPVTVDAVALGAVVVAIIRRSLTAAVVIVVARLGELGTVTVAKVLADRSRPVFVHPLAVAGGQSFPSGHAAGSAALYGALVLLAVGVLHRWWRVAAVTAATVFVLAVAASRLFLGVHFPSDVVAGMAIGVTWAAGAVALGDLLPRAHGQLRPPGVGHGPKG